LFGLATANTGIDSNSNSSDDICPIFTKVNNNGRIAKVFHLHSNWHAIITLGAAIFSPFTTLFLSSSIFINDSNRSNIWLAKRTH